MTGSASARISARSSEKLHIGTAGHAKALQILLAAVAEDLTEDIGGSLDHRITGITSLSHDWLLSQWLMWLQHRWEVAEAQGVCMQRLKDAQSRDM